MLLALIGLVVGFVIGALVFRNNAAKANSLVEKAKDVRDAVRK